MALSSHGLKNHLQDEIFHPSKEKLLSILSVTKFTGRKKKLNFLTLSILDQDGNPIVLLSRVKVMEKKEVLTSVYKRVKTWPLSELKLVDCHSEDSELDFKFDKQILKWVVTSIAEKKSFILNLYKTVVKYKLPIIKFINVDEAKLKDILHSSSGESKAVKLEGSEEVLEQEEYRELSSQEEVDLEDLLSSRRDNAIQDAVAFMENLSEELSQLDQINIRTLMGSEEKIDELMEYLEGGIMEIEKMEMRLTVYDELLAGVRVTMQKLSFQYSHILRQNANLKSLCDEVDELVTKLDLNPRVQRVLQECPLGPKSNVQDCVTAAVTLQKAIDQDLSQGVSILQAVTDQRAFFSKLSVSFARRLQEHLTAQFIHNATVLTENTNVRHASSPTLASHSPVHTDLLVYRDLMKWLKECQPEIFSEVMDAYIRAFRHVYEEQLKGLLKDSRDILQLTRSSDMKKQGGILSKISGSTVDIRSPVGGSLSSLSPARGNPVASQSIADFGTSPFLSGSSQDSPRKLTFDRIFPLVLEQIQPVCVAEQKYLNSFFHFERIECVVEEKEISQSEEEIDGLSKLKKMQELPEDVGSRSLLNQLFSALLPEIEEFIDFGDRQDSYNSLYLLVFVSQRLIFAEESGSTLSYLDETLKKALLRIMRLFDKLIEEKCKHIMDVKFPKGSKCGVLPCVRVFEDFAEHAERIVMAADRRNELDKAYQYLIETLFQTVDRVALDHPKTPHDVIKFENYNKVVDILSRLKIVCLEKSRDEAKKKYRIHKNSYVNNCLGRPLEKLSAFFDGIEKLRASGTKAEEVGFRLEYSKMELRKCIKEYPGKEVKRGLEKLYRRVEKEVSEGELQVVWGNMQSSFMQQCVKFQELIEECYPGSSISLDFSVADLTDYFSSISRSV